MTRNRRAIVVALIAVLVPVTAMLAIGIGAAEGKQRYEIVRDLFIPMVGPTVAFLVPVLLFFVIPLGQNRQRVALDLCSQYFSEELRRSRNLAWKHFVTDQFRLSEEERAANKRHYLQYLTDPEVHRSIDRELDAVYQKTSRVLDFFAIADDCVARGLADPGVVRNFLIFYYVWWRDEIMNPLRAADPLLVAKAKIAPVWWRPLLRLDALAGV